MTLTTFSKKAAAKFGVPATARIRQFKSAGFISVNFYLGAPTPSGWWLQDSLVLRNEDRTPAKALDAMWARLEEKS